MTGLKEIYETYYRNAADVRSKASAFAGVWGMGEDPRKHPCHEMFYQAAEEWVRTFLASAPDADSAAQAVRWILQAPLDHREEDVYWYLYAAHGLICPLIPLLDPAESRALTAWYDQYFPKRERFPAQQQVYKLLKKHGK